MGATTFRLMRERLEKQRAEEDERLAAEQSTEPEPEPEPESEPPQEAPKPSQPPQQTTEPPAQPRRAQVKGATT